MTLCCDENQNEKALRGRTYNLFEYDHSQEKVWEEMVFKSASSTFLHTRKFLSYHGDKFDDQSMLLYDCTGTLRAIFPAARDPIDTTIVVSHPGATYGGLIHDGWLRGERAIDALKQLCNVYTQKGFREIVYKAVPWIYHRTPAQDDIYALFRLGADRYRTDVSATLDLQNRGVISKRRARALKKAIKSGLQTSTDFKYLPAYWRVLAENLKSKYNREPVHSVDELRLLKEKFPNEIELVTALLGQEVQAGTLLFHCPNLIHAQYFASSPTGKEINALDLTVAESIDKAKQLGKRFFDFGISTEQGGNYLNDSLHTFKCEFGAAGSIYEFFRIKIV